VYKMKSEKSRKRDRSESPKSKKVKRRYRNDRSKKWQELSDDSDASDNDSELSEESSADEKRTISKKQKRSKKKRSKKNDKSSDDESSSNSSPDRRKKHKKKTSRHRSSDSDSDDDDDKRKKSKKKIKKRSPSPKKKKKRSESKSPIRKSRRKSRSPLRTQKSRSKSPPRRKKSRSKSPVRRKKSLSKSPVRLKKNRSKSPSRRKKSRSKSPVRRKKSKSKSPSRRKKSRSPTRNKKHRSRSKSPPSKRNRSISKSPTRKTKSPESKSKQKSPESKSRRTISHVETESDKSSSKSDVKVISNENGENQTNDKTVKIKSALSKRKSPLLNELKEINERLRAKKENLKASSEPVVDKTLIVDSVKTPSIQSGVLSFTVKKEGDIKEGGKTDSVVSPMDIEEKKPPPSEIKTNQREETDKPIKSESEIPLLGNDDKVEAVEEIQEIKTAFKPGKMKIEKVKVQLVQGIKRSNNNSNISSVFETDLIDKKQTKTIKVEKTDQINTEKKEKEDLVVFSKKDRSSSSKHKREYRNSKNDSKSDSKSKSDRRSKDENRDSKKRDDRDSKSSKREKSPDRKKTANDIEDEMRKRKERIEQWRKERKKKTETKDIKTEDSEDNKLWSLEDDEDEDESGLQNSKKNAKKKLTGLQNGKRNVKKEIKEEIKEESEEDENLDPLDAYMKSISKEVNKGKGASGGKGTKDSKVKTVTVVKTVVKKTDAEMKLKPQVMEQNQDLLEYSSEEEQAADVTATDFVEVKKRKKEFVVADHTKIYYAPFRREFYVEVPELGRMSDDEVKLYRETMGDIQVRGKNIPKPIKSWSQAGLSSKVMNVMKKLKYVKPTPIQAQAIPVVMSGRDMIGIAKTGSGKTLAFLLPMLRHVLDQPDLEESDGPIAIIMSPTRELALQIYKETRKFCKSLNLSVACIYGGSGISEQIAELKKGAEIIVCTPGRMIDMLAANNGKVTNCRRTTYLVLDEADRMFDMGFEPQVMKILDNIRPDRQTVLFSATFPRQMEAVARKVLQKPIEIQVGGRSIVCSDIVQHALVLDADNKFLKLLELLGGYQDTGSVLVFVEKQDTADVLFKDLLKKGYPCLSLHGGMDQFDRDSTIADFKNGTIKLMVSTSVAARGLDVKNLVVVINYDCPNHYEDYVHRVGRTGRAGNKGTAFTFITYEQGRNAGDLVKAFELSKCEPPADVLALWNGYKEQMGKEGKTVKANSGFSGKGFKFNADEANQVNDAKKMQKFAMGLQDSDDEAEAAENAMDKIEADLEKAFSNKPKVALAPEVKEAHEEQMKVVAQNVDKGKLKQASDVAALLNRKLSSGQIIDRNTTATANIMQGVQLESLKGVGLAKQLADKVNAKLNYKAVEPEKEKEEEKPANVRYEEEIDLNDFPQQARWRITSKEIIEQVRELSEAGITVRGVYIPPNKKPEEDEKRLHLYIESLSERSIEIAKAEIKRLLKEELIRAESNSYRSQNTGRYKVI